MTPDAYIEEDVADIIPYFRRLDVLLHAPAHASGMKVKVLEAMALGVPVVTNEEGVEGLPVEDGTHVGLAEDYDGLVERTVTLLESQGLCSPRCTESPTSEPGHSSFSRWASGCIFSRRWFSTTRITS